MSCSAIAPTTQFLLLHRHHHHHHHHHRPKTFHVSAKANHSDGCFNRRSLLFFSSSSITSFSFPSSLPLSLAAAAAAAEEEEKDASSSSSTSSSDIKVSPSPPLPDTTVTDRIFMDFSICPNYFRSDRTLGDELSACQESEPLGRVVFGLYGKFLPQTVANFKAMCTASSSASASASSYKGTLVQKIFPGQYFVAGRQGRRDKGVVRPPKGLPMNMETLDSRAYVLAHSRPGVLSLCLSENDDDDEIKLDPNYRNVEFLVTTGPGPCPMLDDKNIVFGTVLQGLDVVTTIASIPTYKPAERIRQFNDFAEFIGDERAQNARTIWNRPLKTVYISDCGELKVAKPSLSPTLP